MDDGAKEETKKTPSSPTAKHSPKSKSEEPKSQSDSSPSTSKRPHVPEKPKTVRSKADKPAATTNSETATTAPPVTPRSATSESSPRSPSSTKASSSKSRDKTQSKAPSSPEEPQNAKNASSPPSATPLESSPESPSVFNDKKEVAQNESQNEAPSPSPSPQSPSALPIAPGSAKIPGRGSVVMQRRRNNPLQKPVGWNFAPTDSLDPKIHSKHAKRQNIALEISTTENSYVSSLKHMQDAFARPCQLFLTQADISTMFGNLSEILALHQEFAKAVSERVVHWNYSSTLSDIFAQFIPRMSIYSNYINVFDKGVALINELSQNRSSRFVELLSAFADLPSSHGLDMNAYRIGPVQRLPRLCLLLEDFLKNTIEHHPDYSGTRGALAQLKQVSLAVNAAKGAALLNERFESIAKRLSGWSQGNAKACKAPFLSDARRLVSEDSPMILYGPTRVLYVSLALFSDGILVARRKAPDADSKLSKERETYASKEKENFGPLEFLDWFPVRNSRIRKIGTTQVSKVSKEWSSNPNSTGTGGSGGSGASSVPKSSSSPSTSANSYATLDSGVSSYHWLELQVDEKETFFLGVSELKPWHDWPIKFRETTAELRSKYWSVISQGSTGRGDGPNQPSNSPATNASQTPSSGSPAPSSSPTLQSTPSSSHIRAGGVASASVSVSSSSGNTNSPPPCAYGTLTYVPSRSSFVYFGGISNKLLNAFYTYDMRTRQWMTIWPSRGGPPPALAKHSACLVAGTKIWYYGGLIKNTVTASNDFYTYDTSTNGWEGPIQTNGNGPTRGRAGHTMTSLGGTSTKLYLLGGSTFDDKKQEVILDDMYEFDTATLTWTQLNSAPVARHGHVAAVLEGKLYVWGGRSPNPNGGPIITKDSAKESSKENQPPKDSIVSASSSSGNQSGSSTTLSPRSSGILPASTPQSVAASSSSNLSVLSSALSPLSSSGSGASSSNLLKPSQGIDFSSVVSVYDFAVRDWTEALNFTGFVPSARQWASSAPVQGRHLLVFGGKREALLNDMYLLDVNAETWCRYSLPCLLDHRMSASMQVVERNGVITVYIFGGLQLNPETMDTTSYSDSFVTFQLHNKYIQQTPKASIWSNLQSYSINGGNTAGNNASHAGAQEGEGGTQASKNRDTGALVSSSSTLTSSASTASFNFVSKVIQPANATASKSESIASLCTLQLLLSNDSKFGETWMAVHSRTHLPFAAKVLPKKNAGTNASNTSEEWKALAKAIENAQKCKNSFLAPYLGLMEQPSTEKVWVLSEYCKHGSIGDYLAAGNKLREPQLQYLAFVMLSALQALHASGLTHGNLKATNVLLNDSLDFKVADFSLVQPLEGVAKFEGTNIAPSATTPSLKQDLIALGTTIIEMAEYTPPFKALKKKWSSQMEEFVHRVMEIEPERVLPDLEGLLNHPWIKNAKLSEKLQLELADVVKKSFAKDTKKKIAMLNLPPSTASSAASPASPTAQVVAASSSRPASSKLKREKTASSADSADNPQPSTDGEDNNGADSDSDEVVTLKQRNSVLRKKLRLLKSAYQELKQENAQLKEQLESANKMSPALPPPLNISKGEQSDGENQEPDSPTSPPSSSPPSSSSAIRKSKPSSSKLPTKEKSSRKLKITDGTPQKDEKEGSDK